MRGECVVEEPPFMAASYARESSEASFSSVGALSRRYTVFGTVALSHPSARP